LVKPDGIEPTTSSTPLLDRPLFSIFPVSPRRQPSRDPGRRRGLFRRSDGRHPRQLRNRRRRSRPHRDPSPRRRPQHRLAVSRQTRAGSRRHACARHHPKTRPQCAEARPPGDLNPTQTKTIRLVRRLRPIHPRPNAIARWTAPAPIDRLRTRPSPIGEFVECKDVFEWRVALDVVRAGHDVSAVFELDPIRGTTGGWI